VNIGTSLAIYFVMWWIVLFAVLPFGIRTQNDDKAIVPGTPASAPSRAHFGKAALRTTLVSGVLFGMFYFVFVTLGYTFADLPLLVPERFQNNG
jgi:predicted secreted protein